MTHSKLDIDSILAQYITRETHKGSVNRVRILAKQALLEAFEQSLNTIIGEDETFIKTENGNCLECIADDFTICIHVLRNDLRQDYRNEAIKVIRGNDE